MPQRGSLLWVYEGMTQYWGTILTARSGLWTREQALDSLALTAASYQNMSGREWRSVADTTMDPVLSSRRPAPWRSYLRNEDYYSEGLLVWLDADTLIRERTNNRRSLDDVARAFFGAKSKARFRPSFFPFTEPSAEVERAVGAVDPFSSIDFDRTDYRSRLDAAIDALPQEQSRIIEMLRKGFPIDSKDPSVMTIAKALGRSEKTIRTYRDRAVASLRAALSSGDDQ